jgi:hypothetical protein
MPYQLFSKRWKTMDLVDITGWASNEVRTIQLSQVFLDAPYSVQVRRFVPAPGDMLEEIWHAGAVKKTHHIPPYALENMTETSRMLERWVDDNIGRYINGAVGKADRLLWDTYRMAFRHMGKFKVSGHFIIPSG